MQKIKNYLSEVGLEYVGEEGESFEEIVMGEKMISYFKKKNLNIPGEMEKFEKEVVNFYFFYSGILKIANTEAFFAALNIEKSEWKQYEKSLPFLEIDGPSFSTGPRACLNEIEIMNEILEKKIGVADLAEKIVPNFYLREIFEKEKVHEEMTYAIDYYHKKMCKMIEESIGFVWNKIVIFLLEEVLENILKK